MTSCYPMKYYLYSNFMKTNRYSWDGARAVRRNSLVIVKIWFYWPSVRRVDLRSTINYTQLILQLFRWFTPTILYDICHKYSTSHDMCIIIKFAGNTCFASVTKPLKLEMLISNNNNDKCTIILTLWQSPLWHHN